MMDGGDALSILFVCTANRCRSPMAEALTLRLLSDRDVDGVVHVGSAGFLDDGFAATPHAVQTVAEMGADLSGHRSRRLTPSIAAEAGLVLCMELDHVERCALARDDGIRRIFLLHELAERVRESGPRAEGMSMDAYLSAVAQGRSAEQLLRHGPAWEVADPVGRPQEVYRETAVELNAACGTLVMALWPKRTQTGSLPWDRLGRSMP